MRTSAELGVSKSFLFFRKHIVKCAKLINPSLSSTYASDERIIHLYPNHYSLLSVNVLTSPADSICARWNYFNLCTSEEVNARLRKCSQSQDPSLLANKFCSIQIPCVHWTACPRKIVWSYSIVLPDVVSPIAPITGYREALPRPFQSGCESESIRSKGVSDFLSMLQQQAAMRKGAAGKCSMPLQEVNFHDLYKTKQIFKSKTRRWN